MLSRSFKFVVTLLSVFLLIQSAEAFQAGWHVTIDRNRPVDTTQDSINSSWRSLNADRAHTVEEQDHSPMPPPIFPSGGNRGANDRSQRSSFGVSSSQDYEEIIGRPVGRQEEYQETSGKIEVIYQRYDDGKVQIKRHVMQDAAGNYVKHGVWQLFNRRGQILAEGQYNQGMMEGQWQRWHQSSSGGIFSSAPFNQFTGPYLSQANFRNGILDGTWTILDKNRRKIVEFQYLKGQREGTATWHRVDGMKMREMSFTDGVPNGQLLEWNQQNKVTRQEDYLEGHKVTESISYWRPKQKQIEDHYLEAKLVVDGEDDWWNATFASYTNVGERFRHGVSAAWYDNGQPKMRGAYREGLREGRFSWWHRNGQLDHSGLYRDGMKQGKWTWWHANGMRAHEGEFENDQPIGTWTSWNDDGSLKNTSDGPEFEIMSDAPATPNQNAPTPSNSGELTPPTTGLEIIDGVRATNDDSF